MARAMSFPDRQTVLDFLKKNPDATSKQDIARGLKVKGRERHTLRAILKDLEADGTLTKTGKRAWAQSDVPPSTSVVVFERTNADGDLIARATGKEGPYGPDLIFDGYSGKVRGKAPGVGDRGLARLKERDGIVVPDDLADNYVTLYDQPRSCWTFEMDVRPWIENW